MTALHVHPERAPTLLPLFAVLNGSAMKRLSIEPLSS
jgi:hypothetical protein